MATCFNNSPCSETGNISHVTVYRVTVTIAKMLASGLHTVIFMMFFLFSFLPSDAVNNKRGLCRHAMSVSMFVRHVRVVSKRLKIQP